MKRKLGQSCLFSVGRCGDYTDVVFARNKTNQPFN